MWLFPNALIKFYAITCIFTFISWEEVVTENAPVITAFMTFNSGCL